MIGVEAQGVGAVRAGLARDADRFRKEMRLKMRKGLRVVTDEAQAQVSRVGIVSRTGTLVRSIRGVVRRVNDYEIKGIVKPRRVNLGFWVDTKKKRVGDPFYWYFLEYGTRGGFARNYKQASRILGRGGSGRTGGIRASGFLKAAAAATRERVVAIAGESLDVFFD